MENSILKIKEKNGRITTLTVESISVDSYVGKDKFGADVIISKDEIYSLFTLHLGEKENGKT